MNNIQGLTHHIDKAINLAGTLYAYAGTTHAESAFHTDKKIIAKDLIEVSDDIVDHLKQALDLAPETSSAHHISKAEATAELLSNHADFEGIDALIPASLVQTVAEMVTDQLERAKDTLPLETGREVVMPKIKMPSTYFKSFTPITSKKTAFLFLHQTAVSLIDSANEALIENSDVLDLLNVAADKIRETQNFAETMEQALQQILFPLTIQIKNAKPYAINRQLALETIQKVRSLHLENKGENCHA